MQTNGEAIYETRPWKIHGEGPHIVKSGSYQGASVGQMSVEDVRFTRNKANTIVYAMLLGWPTQPVLVRALGLATPTTPGKIARVELLGTGARLNWKQLPDGLHVEFPNQYHPTADYAAALKITLA